MQHPTTQPYSTTHPLALVAPLHGEEQLAPSHPKHRGDSAVLPGLAASAVARALREDSSEAPPVAGAWSAQVDWVRMRLLDGES